MAAILLGNLIYFGLLPWLPPSLVHQPYEIDLGVLVDLALCGAAYAAIRRLLR